MTVCYVGMIQMGRISNWLNEECLNSKCFLCAVKNIFPMHKTFIVIYITTARVLYNVRWYWLVPKKSQVQYINFALGPALNKETWGMW